MPLKGLTPGIFASFPSPKPNLGTNTGDATAIAADIALGKIAYGVLGKLIGTTTRIQKANGSLTTDGSGNFAVSGLAFTPTVFILYQHATNASVFMELLVGITPADLWNGASSGVVLGIEGWMNSALTSTLTQKSPTFSANGFSGTVTGTSLPLLWRAYE